MARKKKNGRRATGIQAKGGKLYIIITQNVVEDGKVVNKKKWIATGLPETADNIKRVKNMRDTMIEKMREASIDPNIEVNDYIELFLDKKKRSLADTTFSAYWYKAQHIIRFFKGFKIRELRETDVERFLDALFQVYGLSPRTAKDVKTIFAEVMETAKEDGLTAYNPVKKTTFSRKLVAEHTPEKNEDDEFFSFDEAQTFLNRVKKHELKELFYVTITFGLRREEVLGLKWTNIDLVNKTLKIRHTVTRGTSVNRLNATKTRASNRDYPLTDEQVRIFQKLKEKEQKNRKLCGKDYQNNDYVFKHVDGSLYYPDYPTKAFAKIIRANPDLPQDITFHGLRSSCVSILVHKGVDVKTIQKWVGHADINTTLKIYAKVKDKEAKKQAAESMGDLILPEDDE